VKAPSLQQAVPIRNFMARGSRGVFRANAHSFCKAVKELQSSRSAKDSSILEISKRFFSLSVAATGFDIQL
jgi:hypothetical protein